MSGILLASNPFSAGGGGGGGGGSGFSLLVHHIKQGNANTTTTDAKDTTGAGLIVLAVAHSPGVVPTMTDSQTNTWETIRMGAVGGYADCTLFFCVSPATNANHTFTATGTNTYPCVEMSAWSGQAADCVGEWNGHGQNGVTSLPSGQVCPIADGALVITNIGHTMTTASIDSGLTVLDNVAINGGVSYGQTVAYDYASIVAGKLNPTWTLSSDQPSARVAVFLPDTWDPGSAPYFRDRIGVGTYTFAAASTYTITLNKAAAIGDRVVVVVNRESGVTVSSIADSGGNTYAVDVSCNGSGQYADICSAVLTTALVAGNTITITWSSSSGQWCGASAFKLKNCGNGVDVTGTAASSFTATPTKTVTTSNTSVLVAVFPCNTGFGVSATDGVYEGDYASNGGQLAMVFKSDEAAGSKTLALTADTARNFGVGVVAYY